MAESDRKQAIYPHQHDAAYQGDDLAPVYLVPSGALHMGSGELVTSGLSGTVNDLALANDETGVFFTSHSGFTITGMTRSTKGTVGRGKFVTLTNQTGNAITIKHNDAASTLGNRFATPSLGDYTFAGWARILVVYNGDTWMLVGPNA